MRFLCVAFTAVVLASPAPAAEEALLRKAPHYAGKVPAAVPAPAHAPLMIGRTFTEPGPDAALRAAIEARIPGFETYLTILVPDRITLPAGEAPFVYVGAPDGFHAPLEWMDAGDETARPRDAFLVFAADPPGAWRKALVAAVADAGASHVLIVALELSDYPVAQKNFKGSKAIDLGSGHTLPLPWLTSLDQPVEVLHWTGALYRADGRLVRAGAEGFYALRTRFVGSVAGVQRTLTAETFAAALEARRADLPGEPPAWQAAMRELVRQLTGRDLPPAPGNEPQTRTGG